MNVRQLAKRLYEEAANQEKQNDHLAASLMRRASCALLNMSLRIESARDALKDGDEVDGI